MNLQETLYKKAERHLVIWCVVAMIIMSASFLAISYFLSIDRLEQVENMAAQTTKHNPHQIAERTSNQNIQAMEGKQKLATALFIGQGTLVAVGAVFTVVFARKTLRPIRKAHKAQAEFAANAHHQLRTPIAVMQAEVEVALLSAKPSQKKPLENILEEVTTLRHVSEHLLTYADATNATINSTTLKSLVSSLNKRYKTNLKVTSPPDTLIPLSEDAAYLLCDILLDNSLKHSGKTNRTLQASLIVEDSSKKIVVRYHDNGKGVAKSHQERIFTRGYRASKLSGGSGIGLAIVHDIVTARKGTIKANSNKNGFEIQITLPKI